MTAYSFGARWVGIISMRDTPALVPEPLHKMAERLHKQRKARPVRVTAAEEIPTELVLRRLPAIRAKYLQAGDRARALECRAIEQALRRGKQPRLRPWLSLDLLQQPGLRPRKGKTPATTPAARPRSARPTDSTGRLGPTKSGVPPLSPGAIAPATNAATSHETGWAESFPLAPMSPWLPPLPDLLETALASAGINLQPQAREWVRWALLHKSYLYEAVPDGAISAGTLKLLELLGRNWLRVALLEHARETRGDLESRHEASLMLTQDTFARASVSTWLLAASGPRFGQGEQTSAESGQSRAAQDVAMQVLGALSLASASTRSARAAILASGFHFEDPEPDWFLLIRATAGRDPQVSRAESGPANNKTFTITVTVNGRAASGTGRSAKAARRAAGKAWIQAHAPGKIPRAPQHRDAPEPRMIESSSGHDRGVAKSIAAFAVDAPGLFSQAFIHRSWMHENKDVAARSYQRDYGVLATEGSEILRTLVNHHYAVKTLSTDVAIAPDKVLAPSPTDTLVAELFDTLRLDDAVLCSRGLSFAAELKADVVQALVGAAWRGAPGQLAHQQFAELAQWVQAFIPRRDPTTALQDYGAIYGMRFDYAFDERGPAHSQEFRATVKLVQDRSQGIVGEWTSAKTPAKHSASHRLLRLLAAQSDVTHDAGRQLMVTSEERAMLRACLLAELRAIDPVDPPAQRDLLAGRMGIDSLVAGDFATFNRWAAGRAQVLPANVAATSSRASGYYYRVLGRLLRARVRDAVLPLLPSQPREPDGMIEAVITWSTGDGPAQLALLADLVAAVAVQRDAPAAIASFVETQTRTIADLAGRQMEAVASSDSATLTVTARVAGINLQAVSAPIVEIVDVVTNAVSWSFEGDALSVVIARSPHTTTPLAAEAFEALRATYADPWLGDVQRKLRALLDAAEEPADLRVITTRAEEVRRLMTSAST